MFRSAVNKLTLWYVAALVLVVLILSLPIFELASSRLDRASQKQSELLLRESIILNVPPTQDFLDRRQALVVDERGELLKQIMVLDLSIVLIGAISSYYFAKRTLKPIEDAHIAQTRFTSDASHQLRTPLATMQSEIEVVLRDKKSGKKEFSQTLGSNLEEISRLSMLSNQLLLLTKIDNNLPMKNSFSWKKTVLDRLTQKEKQTHIRFTRNISGKSRITGDEQLLGEVVTILLDNAVSYANPENPQVTVSLKTISGKSILTVDDNGPGIDDKDLQKIFDRFYRGNNSSVHGTGNGLGLALAKEIITKHNGQIFGETIPDKGSRFTVELEAQ